MWEVGNDFSAVQGAVDANNRMRDEGIARGIAALTQGFRDRNQVAEANRNFAVQQRQYQDTLRQRALENSFRQSQANFANRKLDQQTGISQGYLDLGNRQLALQQGGGTPAQIRDREFIINRAASDADRGMFENPDHVRQLYPSIPPEMAQGLAAHSANARQTTEDNYNFASNAAQALNRQAVLEANIKKAKDNFGMLKDNRGDRENIANWSQELAQLQKFNNKLQSDKRFHDLVTLNPTDGRYLPTVTPPSWMKDPNDRTGAGAPDAGTGTVTNAPADPSTSQFQTRGAVSGLADAWPSGFGGTMPASPGASASPAMVPSPFAPRPAYTPRMAPQFYDRVNQLIGNGVDPASAKAQATQEMNP